MREMKPATRYFLMALVAVLVIVAAITTADAARKKYKASSDEAYLGIYMQEVDKDLAEAFNLEVDHGAFVADVVDDSPAENAGLRDRDVIIEFDGKPVNDTDQLTEMIREHKPGDTVNLKVLRRNKERDVTVELGEEDENSFTVIGRNGNIWSNFDNTFLFSGDRGGYLGVTTLSLSEQLADYFGVRYGVLIDEVEEDSPAAQAGLKAGDVIIKVQDEQINSPSDLAEVIGDHQEGDEVKVTVFRDKAEQEFTATLDEGSSFGGIRNIDPIILNVPNPPTPTRAYFKAQDDYREEMEQLQLDLKELQEELEGIKEKLK